MSDELKSAWELALEKLEARDDMAVDKLSPEQKEAMAEIRKKYQARIAELEINTQSKIRKALRSGAHDELGKLQDRLVEEKARLNREKDRELEKIREAQSG